jgi:putative ABC transport system permease protein
LTIDLLVRFNPRGAGGMHPVFDLRAAAFGCAVAAVTGTLATLWPGLTVLRGERPALLRQGPQQGTDSPRQRFSQRALVMCQIACALVVLTGAGLLAKTVLRMQSYDPGVDTRHLLTAEVTLPQGADGRGSMLDATRFLDELQAVPGVLSAGLVSASGLSSTDGVMLRTEGGDARAAVIGSNDRMVQVSAGYLDALGVPLVQGRMLTPDEYRAQARVALVNEEAVRRWWSGSTGVVGSQIKVGDNPWTTIVGVVRNTGPLTIELLASDPSARVFLPMAGIRGSVLLNARTAGDPLAVLPTVHARTLALDRRIRIQMPEEVNTKIGWEISQHLETASFVGGLAAFGLLLAAMGIYGVTTYAVARRIREIGIRKALGASTGHVVLTVSRETAGLAVGGIAIGLATSAGVTRLLDSMLYGTSPLDPSVFAGASLLIFCIVAIATWVPLRTALRVDPMATLRCE